jgi:hypothetical protein
MDWLYDWDPKVRNITLEEFNPKVEELKLPKQLSNFIGIDRYPIEMAGKNMVVPSPIRSTKKKSRKRPSPSTRISANTSDGIIARTMNRPPQIYVQRDATIVCNSEQVVLVQSNVTTDAPGHPVRVPIYPPQTQWLNNLALNYSKYRFKKLVMVYVPSCSTATSGSFTMALGYDYNDQAPSTSQQITTFYRSVTAPIWGGADGTSMVSSENINRRINTGVYIEFDTTRVALNWYPYVTQTEFNASTTSAQNTLSPAYLTYYTSGAPTTSGSTSPITFGVIYWNYELEMIEPMNAALQ